MLEAIIWYDKNVLARLRATVKTTKGGGCVDKYKRLVSNTLLFAISTFSSKILSFFLTAYRTRVMGAADYGGMDAIVTIGNFFIPLVSLGIANAIIRFGLEKGVNKRQLYTNGLLSIFAGFLLLCALAPVLNLVPFVRDTVQGHWMWLLLFVLVSCLRTLNCQFVRARNLVRLYALDGILCTLTNLLFNVLFLSGLNLGAQGWILALICSDACSALFLFFVSSIWRYMGGRINTKLWRKMLVYSVPLISASIFWTVTNTSDKLFITAMLGAEWNGLFAACYQLPTLLTVVATLFTEAWQLSAFTDGTQYDITNRLDNFSLNTVISGFMEYNNKFIELAKKEGGIDKESLDTMVLLLAPFAPHITEELWEALGHTDSVFHNTWPAYEEEAMKDDEKEVAVQINGKTKAVISLPVDVTKEAALEAGKAAIAQKLTGTIVKEIYVPGRIINIVQK